MRLTTVYDSESNASTNKLTTKLFNNRAKVKATFQASPEGFSEETLRFVSELFEAAFHVPSRAALLKFHTKRVRGLRVSYVHDVQDKDGEIVADWQDKKGDIRANATFALRDAAMTEASLKCPLGVLLYQHYESDVSPAGIQAQAVAPIARGIVLAEANSGTKAGDVSYKYKDDDITVMSSVAYPSWNGSMTFKRRVDDTNKLGFRYFPLDMSWRAEYRYRDPERPEWNMKAGVVSESDQRVAFIQARLGKWTKSMKRAPRWGIWEAMVQVMQAQPTKPVFLLRWKKRWELFEPETEPAETSGSLKQTAS